MGKGQNMADMTTALTTSLTSISTSIMGVLGDVAPIGLSIVGAVMVLIFGIKIFKKITNK